jgi:hypothetical protein
MGSGGSSSSIRGKVNDFLDRVREQLWLLFDVCDSCQNRKSHCTHRRKSLLETPDRGDISVSSTLNGFRKLF